MCLCFVYACKLLADFVFTVHIFVPVLPVVAPESDIHAECGETEIDGHML